MMDTNGSQSTTLRYLHRDGTCSLHLQVKIHKASGDVYSAVVDDKVAVKIGPGDWSPSSYKVDVGQKKWKMAVNGH